MSKLYFEAATIDLGTQRLGEERVFFEANKASDFATQPEMKLQLKPAPSIGSKI